jgi:hypothetical protein
VLIEEVLEGGGEAECLGPLQSKGLIDVEVRLREQRVTVGVRGSYRDRTGALVLRDIGPRTAAEDIDREVVTRRQAGILNVAGVG